MITETLQGNFRDQKYCMSWRRSDRRRNLQRLNDENAPKDGDVTTKAVSYELKRPPNRRYETDKINVHIDAPTAKSFKGQAIHHVSGILQKLYSGTSENMNRRNFHSERVSLLVSKGVSE